MSKGTLIILEGGEGVGKTTIAKALVEDLKKKGKKAIYLKEPGGTEIADKIRELILYTDNMNSFTEYYLFLAARSENIINVVKYLEEDYIVVLDRFALSTVVYQALMGDIPYEYVVKDNRRFYNRISTVTENILHYLLICDAHTAYDRVNSGNHELNKYDTKSIEWYEFLHKNYHLGSELLQYHYEYVNTDIMTIEDSINYIEEDLDV